MAFLKTYYLIDPVNVLPCRVVSLIPGARFPMRSSASPVDLDLRDGSLASFLIRTSVRGRLVKTIPVRLLGCILQGAVVVWSFRSWRWTVRSPNIMEGVSSRWSVLLRLQGTALHWRRFSPCVSSSDVARVLSFAVVFPRPKPPRNCSLVPPVSKGDHLLGECVLSAVVAEALLLSVHCLFLI